MMLAVDDGTGRVVAELRRLGVEDNTMIVFTSDNGAPTKIHKEDITLDFRGGAWDGSINDPLNGEKGTLLEGGIRVPFVMTWPDRLPAGKVSDTPVITLDIAATALAAAGATIPSNLDGVDIVPHLAGEAPAPDRALFWRFWSQTAVRLGDWKLLALSSGDRYLFNLADDLEETRNRLADAPAIAAGLERRLKSWCGELTPEGLPTQPLNDQERAWYAAYTGWRSKPAAP
ncbi:MAG: sulfatase-like hydrolase/transferase [Planctomycetota bacterium]